MEANKKFESWLNEYIETEHLSGSVQISRGGECIYKKHFGFEDIAKNIPINDDTKFRYYSISKPFTAIAIMQLYEKGLLKLEDKVCEILPTAKNLNPAVTVGHLLRHNSGLVEIPGVPCEKENGEIDFAVVVDAIAAAPMDFEPGGGVMYRNTNFMILSLIVEELSGMKLKDYLKNKVFEPLGMTTAVCEFNGDIIPHKAVGYKYKDGEFVTAGNLNMNLIYGAAFVVGRVADLDCLHKAIREKKLLKPETWELIFTVTNAGAFCLGCSVIGGGEDKYCQHNGGSCGFRTIHRYYFNRDFDVILLLNCESESARDTVCNKAHEIYCLCKA